MEIVKSKALVFSLSILAACGGPTGGSRAPEGPDDGGANPPGRGGAPGAPGTPQGGGPGGGAPGAALRGDAAAPPGGAQDAAPGVAFALPVVMIDVQGQKFLGMTKEDPAKNKLLGRMKIVEDHDGAGDLAGALQRPATVDVPIEVGYRGGASLYFFPKKGYSVELRDPANPAEEKGLPLLGMPKGKEWALVACYSDKTCLRNMLVYELGAELGRPYFAPRFRFVELFVDGQYQGIYHFQEKIKRDKDRVDLPKVTDDDVTGGYIVSRNGNGDGPGSSWTTPGGNIWSLVEPSAKKITTKQREYIIAQINAFEALMTSGNAFDPKTGYRSRIDVPSFVDFLLMQELTKNADGYRRSAYTIKQADSLGGKLAMGTLWDFDLGYGNSGGDKRWYGNEWARPDLWVHQIMKPSGAPENVPAWWYKLLEDPAFTTDLRCRWNELRRGVVTMARLNEKIDRGIRLLAAARVRDQAKWPTIGKKVWPNFWVGNSYEEEIEWLRRWLDHRVRFIDANLPGTCAAVPAPAATPPLPAPSILPPKDDMAKTSPPLSPPAPSLEAVLAGTPAASPTPSPVRPAPSPPPVLTPPGAAAVSCKRGLAFGRHAPEDMVAISRAISWYYNWSFKPEASVGDAHVKAGVEYVPMVWGKSFDVEELVAGIPAGAKYLLGFNEPNFARQANLTPQEAARLWPKLEEVARRRGLKLVSPAVNYCGSSSGGCNVKDPIEWLEQFFAACAGCQVDYVAGHMYSCYGEGIQSMVDKLKTFGKPIWLTEFACDYDAEPTPARHTRVMTEAVASMEKDPMVFRYAWFTGRETKARAANTLGAPGQLAPLGETYVSLPYAQACPR
jgi:hypothetical protein